MRNLLIFIFCVVMLSHLASAQKQYDKWFFGNKAALDFSSGSPVALAGSQMNTDEGCASIADSCTGNLLFYTNGITVWDRNNNAMPNGTGLRADISSTQAAMIVPSVGNANRYYVFATHGSSATGFTYSEVDMTLNGGLGDVVVATKNTLLNTTSDEKVTATMHSNCKDIWVLNHSGNSFRAYLITSAGVNTTPVVSTVGMNNVGYGAMKLSNFGKKLLLLDYTSTSSQLLDFNNTTGVVSNPITINVSNAYGGCFSPDDNLFYITKRDFIYQYETYSANVSASMVTIYNQPGLYTPQLSPKDCKIYVCQGADFNTTSLGVINNPNSKTNPNYTPNAIPLQPPAYAVTRDGLPNFLIFQPCIPTPGFKDSIPACSKTAYFEDTSQYCIKSRLWDFGDPASGTADTSSLQNPSHSFSSKGSYTISLILKRGRCMADTISRIIAIDSFPTADAGNDTAICKGNTVTLYGNGGPSYLWSTGDTTANTIVSPTITTTYSLIVSTSVNCNDTDYVIVTVDSAIAYAGADTVICYQDPAITLTATGGGTYKWSTNATSQTINVSPNTTTTYTVTVNVGNCTDTDEVVVTVNPLPTINLGPDKTICMGASYTFNAGVGYSTYQWHDGKTTQTYTAKIEGTYSVTVTDANDCSASDDVLLKLKPCDTLELWVPNAFTPNGDGINDDFKAKGEGITNFKMYIFNRWGELLFESDNINNSWNGTFKENKCQDGVYSWIIFYEGLGKGEEMKVGSVALIK